MRNLLTTALLLYLLFPFSIQAQHNNSSLPTSINQDGSPPDESAILHLQSTNQGLLIPRLDFCDIEEISNPAEGLMIYDTEFNCLRIYIQGSWNCLYGREATTGNRLFLTGWSSTPLDEGYDTDIGIDIDENIYVVTETEDSEIRLAKYDKKGNLQWSIFTYANAIQSVDLDSEASSFVVGRYNNLPFQFNGQVIQSAPGGSSLIIKTSSDGSTSDVLALNKSFTSVAAEVDPFDNYVLLYSQYIPNNNNSQFDNKIDKYDNNLNLLWSAHLDNILSGGYNKIDVDSNGDIYVAISYTSGGPVNNSYNDQVEANNIYVTKLNGQNGQMIWERNISNVNKMKLDNIFISGDEVYVIGSFNPFHPYISGQTFFIQRYGEGLGQTGYYTEIDRMFIIGGSDLTSNENEICLQVSEVINDNREDKLIFISTITHEILNERHVDFGVAGHIVYNDQGNRVYGIARGELAGNTVITSTGESGETNIIFKVQKE